MQRTFALTFSAALLAAALAAGAGAFAQSPPAPSHESPQSGMEMHKPGMMDGGTNGMDQMDMSQMNRMMGNCNRMMEGMRQTPSGAAQPTPDHG
jgi:hypothetical protein